MIWGIAAVFLLLNSSCEDFTDNEIYQPPPELEGKLYDQIQLGQNSDLSVFAEVLERTGLWETINKTGYFTVFAPVNEAFDTFFAENPQYAGSLENIPAAELEKIARFHIIQNGWTLNQLVTLDYKGWIDNDDPFYNQSKGFKRETILKDSLRKEWVIVDQFENRIVNEQQATEYKIVFPDSRKYVPLFYQQYFSAYNYSSDDYAYYFGRPIDDPSAVYYANAKILSEEIPAENGFIYKTDRVVTPMSNLQQIIESKDNYAEYLDLVYQFPEFTIDIQETFNQPGAREGRAIDTLYDLRFPDLEFSLNKEETGNRSSSVNYTLREHNTLIAPTNEAIQELYNTIVLSTSGYPHYSRKSDIPNEITRIIVNSHMIGELLYRKDFAGGFRNGAGDFITLDESEIIEREYGSNGVFLGVNKAIVPFAFKSVAAAVYLRPQFQTFFKAIEYTNTLPALTKQDVNYSFYIIEDARLQQDSSLLFVWDDEGRNRFHFDAYDRGVERFVRIRQSDLTKWVMNQIVLQEPRGIARKEFLENLGGNYIIIDNQENTVRGSVPTTYGYEGDSVITLTPVELNEPSENGSVYRIDGWLLNTLSSVYNELAKHQKFINLLDKAKLAEKLTFRMLFLSETEFYTVFVPTDAALEAYGADTLSIEALTKLLRRHFVKGHLIFTDGSKPSGQYETMQLDEERSDQFNTYFTSLDILTGPDEIEILDADGNPQVTIEEDPARTNFMAGRDVDKESGSRYDVVTNCVIHVIDQVLE